METINGDWILRRMKGKRGEKAALARALGIGPDMVTKILSGERNVQPAEIGPLLEFFGEAIRPAAGGLDDIIGQTFNQLSEEAKQEARAYIEYLASRKPKAQEESAEGQVSLPHSKGKVHQ